MLAKITLKPIRNIRPVLLLIFLIHFLSPSFAQVALAPIFGSNMVLQRGAIVPVFGSAPVGTNVTVQFLGQSVSAVADATGKWRVNLASMTANATPNTLTVTSANSSSNITGVQVGEVWFCSGQSNMGLQLSGANNSAADISSAGTRNIRLFRMIAGSGPSGSTWQISNSSTVGNFSAVGYWMGLEFSKWFGNVPIGLVQATHDGTSIDHWQHSSGGIGDDYDAMVKSIQPFAVKGVAWYQGESNGGDVDYKNKLTNMIREWRTDWGLSSLPFGIIQLAYRSGWNTARNAQLEVSDTEPQCFLVVIRDLPGGALHPTEKKAVGVRTAIGARGLVYGDNIVYSGPVRDVANSFVTGNKVVLKWKFLGTGLFTNDGAAPGGFSLATSTGQFKAATAVIVGNTVEVSSSVVNPTRVQYAYSSIGNLYNRVSVPTEEGAVIVDRLKASEFQINVASAAPLARLSLETGKANRGNAIFPQPAVNGNFTIRLSELPIESQVNVTITDELGKVVYQANKKTAGTIEVSSQLNAGVYFVRLVTPRKVLINEMIIVQ